MQYCFVMGYGMPNMPYDQYFATKVASDSDILNLNSYDNQNCITHN